jgi:hypothetical protein
MWRQTSIHNALSHLAGRLDPALYDRVHRSVLHDTGDPRHAEAVAWAAVITDAVRQDTAPANPVDRAESRVPGPGPRVPGPAALVRVADVLAGPADLAAVRERGAAAPTGSV